ncbi:MAG: hypothetical protein QQN63_06860 [Nitrosopumilus sp.]
MQFLPMVIVNCTRCRKQVDSILWKYDPSIRATQITISCHGDNWKTIVHDEQMHITCRGIAQAHVCIGREVSPSLDMASLRIPQNIMQPDEIGVPSGVVPLKDRIHELLQERVKKDAKDASEVLTSSVYSTSKSSKSNMQRRDGLATPAEVDVPRVHFGPPERSGGHIFR